MKKVTQSIKSLAMLMAVSVFTLAGCSNHSEQTENAMAEGTETKKMSNMEIVRTALTEAFINGDLSAIDKYWAEDYIQHNPMVGNGREALKQFFSSMAGKIKYEMGMMAENGEFVMVHGRFTGFGPKPLIAVDIVRVKDGKLVEHWDVLQEEVPADSTASKNPMFSPNL